MSGSGLDEALAEAEVRASSLAHAQHQHDRLTARRAELVLRVEGLEELAELEAADVERVEQGGFMVLLECLLEGREDRLARERAEALRAKLALDAAREELVAVDEQLAAAQATLATHAGADRDLATLRDQQRRALAGAGHPSAARLAAIDEERALAEAMLVELARVLAAGEGAREALVALSSAMKAAHGLSARDVHVGGGMHLKLQLRESLDVAHKCAVIARRRLEAFDREVSEAGQQLVGMVAAVDVQPLDALLFDGGLREADVEAQLRQGAEQVRLARLSLADRYGTLAEARDQAEQLLAGLTEEAEGLLRGGAQGGG